MHRAVAWKSCVAHTRIPGAQTPRLARLPQKPTKHDVLATFSRNMVGGQGQMQPRSFAARPAIPPTLLHRKFLYHTWGFGAPSAARGL
jgi:hypothetical protein